MKTIPKDFPRRAKRTVVSLKRIRYGRLIALSCLVFMLFFDENSIIKHIRYEMKIRELKQEIEHYETLIDESKIKLKELNSDDVNLEKFAREQFLMKQANEDIYLVDPRQ